jgi:hypothetical protein
VNFQTFVTQESFDCVASQIYASKTTSTVCLITILSLYSINSV